MKLIRRTFVLHRYIFAVLLPLVGTALLWPLRDVLSSGNFSLIFLLIVLIVAFQRGTRASLLAALVSFLCVNFFLVRPFFTFLVTEPHDLLTLIIFLVCAALTGQLASQRIELAERVQRSKTFEEADRLKTALLHAVSHDLRTPITIIKTSASNLLRLYATLPEPDRTDMLKVIESEADQLDKMVGNLLDISRLKAGALQMNRAWNSLEEVAGDVAARVFQRTHEERIKLVFPENMSLVEFDFGLVLQALTNLVDNALRYEPEGSQVEICGRTERTEAVVKVVNHGPNIQPDERDQIMEPFYHGEGGNIGLGLAIAKGIVEAHNGRIWIEDTPGGGATFAFSLPGVRKVGEIHLADENPGR